MKRERLIIIMFIIASFVPFYIFDKNKISYLTKEDGFYESFGAFFLFLSALLSIYIWYRDNQGNDFYFIKIKKNIFYLLLGLFFLFAAGEEISWGQRFFNFSTPSYLAEINVQKEFNIHNIEVLTTSNKNESYFSLKSIFVLLFAPGYILRNFIFVFCFLIPILFRKITYIKKILCRINIPISNMDIFFYFVITYLMSRLTGILIEGERSSLHWIIEVKEYVYEFLVFCMIYNFK